mmetsp:Transcript_103099/g.245569  ORF Transcript_103099/g.245569 Transcript_103099/m.245569 type:complete len:82 (+) Transcript_103099:239-484(+)
MLLPKDVGEGIAHEAGAVGIADVSNVPPHSVSAARSGSDFLQQQTFLQIAKQHRTITTDAPPRIATWTTNVCDENQSCHSR